MSTCSICYEKFTAPVSLPCGHVFCKDCIRRAVDSNKSSAFHHACPTCRAPFPLLTIDPRLVPTYLRPHFMPPIRPVFFDNSGSTSEPAASTSTSTCNSAPTESTSSGSSSGSAPTSRSISIGIASAADARVAAELDSLRLACATWRRRAELHAASNTGLLSFARAAKDCALRLRAERDASRNRCALLKRKLSELLPDSPAPSASDAEEVEADREHARRDAAARTGLPVYLMQCQSAPPNQFYENPADADAEHFGPAIKRRRRSNTVAGLASEHEIRDPSMFVRSASSSGTRVRDDAGPSPPPSSDLDSEPDTDSDPLLASDPLPPAATSELPAPKSAPASLPTSRHPTGLLDTVAISSLG